MKSLQRIILSLSFLMAFAFTAHSQTITGTVSDSDGEPLIGASVLIEGTAIGSITDLDGKYSLNAPEGSVLVASCIGFKQEKRTVGKSTVVDFVLSVDNELLEEVVVVGYGTQKKVNLTGAVSSVDAEDLANRKGSTLSSMLQGSIPNVNIKFSNGQAGQEGSINIRGVTSIASGTGPLVLLDGVETAMSDVNPADVESISVLKDASASAIYGSRAAFGVILITTKKGSQDEAKVTYNGSFSFGTSTTSTDFETRGYYHAYINDMFYRTYQGINYTSYTNEDYHELWLRRNDKVEDPSRPWVVEKDGEYKYYGNFDWYNMLYDNTRPTHSHNVTVSGGTSKVRYLMSGSYFNQKGVSYINPDHYRHATFRSKIEADVKPWLTVSNNTSYSYRYFDWPGTTSNINDYYNSTWTHALASEVPINPDGTLVYYSSAKASEYAVMGGIPAIALASKHVMHTVYKELRTTFEAVLKPTKHFDLRVNYSFTNLQNDHFNRFANVSYSKYPGVVVPDLGIATTEDKIQESFNLTQRQAMNAYATYDNKLAGSHDLKLMVGANYEYKYYKKNYMRRYDLQSEVLSDFNLATGDQYYTSGGQNDYAILGFFYRANYGFKDRYLLEVSGRYDGSSRFSPGHRFGFFPSFSAGWRISEEPFFESAKSTIEHLKLRVSYGSLGNQSAVGYYDYIQTINTSGLLNYAFGDGNKAAYAYESDPNRTDISWEKVYTGNVGVDMTMLKGRLNLTLDAYVRDTKDMIMQSEALPATYGAAAPKANSADLRTLGWELALSWNDTFELGGKPFHYSLSGGIGDNVSYVTRYDNPGKNLSEPYVGQKLGSIWGYRIDGYFLSDEEASNWAVDQSIVNDMINTEVIDQGLHAGDLKFKDLDGNGVIEQTTSADNVKDQEIIGNSLPRFNYSFTLAADWRGFDFSAMFQGIGHQDWYPGNNCAPFWGPYSRPYGSFVPTDFMSKVWTEETPDAYFPRPRGYVALKTNRELGVANDKYLQNVGYLRLKNLTFGYTLPKDLTRRAKIEKLRIYFSGENLLTASSLQTRYLDPEQASAGCNWNSYSSDAMLYPYAKTYTFGIDVTF